MKHLFISQLQTEENWIGTLIRPEDKVLIIDFEEDRYPDDPWFIQPDPTVILVEMLRENGVSPSNIRKLRTEDEYEAAKLVEMSDAVIIAEHDPSLLCGHFLDLDLFTALRHYSGLVVAEGNSGSLLADGDGLILEMHYAESEEQVGRVIRKIEETGRDAVVCGESGGVLIENDSVSLFGDATLLSFDDLDFLYLRI